MAVQDADVSLILRAARGDMDAFASLFDTHYRPVYEYALWLSGDPDLAEDLTQETFIRAHKNLHRLGPPWKIRAWLCRLARNLYIDHYRQSPFAESLDPDAPIASNEPDPERALLAEELSDPVKAALNKLSPAHREALVLREVGGFPYNEIAEIMATSLDNVKVLIHRARSHFKENYSVRLLAEDPLPRCDELADLLDAWHDGEITGDQDLLVRAHIKQCETCQQRKRELAAMLLLLRGMRLPTPRLDLRSRVMKGISQPEAPPAPKSAPKKKNGGPLAAALSMGMFMVLGLAIFAYFSFTDGMGGGGGDEPPTQTAIPTPVPPAAPAVQNDDGTTTQVFPVWYCTHLGNNVFEWYEVEVTYENGVPVSEQTLSGPYTGTWQSGCPLGEPTPVPASSEEPQPSCQKSCGNRVCERVCGEDPASCPADCYSFAPPP